MNQKGQATVELALTLTILMVIFISLIDVGLIYYNKLLMNHMGQEVIAIVRKEGSETDVQNYLDTQSQLDLNKLIISYSTSIPAVEDTLISVDISYEVPVIGPVTSAVLGTSFTITETYVTKVE